MLLPAFLLLFGSTAQADTVSHRGTMVATYLAYADCIKTRTVELGAFDDREPAVVVQAAAELCVSGWKGFVDAMIDGSDDANGPRDDSATVKRYQQVIFGAAAAELVAVRQGRCGTRTQTALRC